MSFSDWKAKSKLFQAFRSRAENYGIGLAECCQAAYKAGERQGRKDVEEIAIMLLELNRSTSDNP